MAKRFFGKIGTQHPGDFSRGVLTAGGRVAPIGSGQWNPCGPLERGRTDTSESTSPPVTSGKKRRPISPLATRPCPPPAYSAPGTHHHPSFNICYLTDNPGGSSIFCALFVAPCLDCTTSSSSLSHQNRSMHGRHKNPEQERFAPPARPLATSLPAADSREPRKPFKPHKNEM